MDETTYHRLADGCLQAIMERIETQDTAGLVDCELAGGVLTIEMPSGKQLVVSKHTLSRQIWLASPLSGGLHFRHEESGGWRLPDGRELEKVLEQDYKLLMSGR